MNLPFELHIAFRYLLAKRKQALLSIITLISTLGVIVGVMAVVIALALMTGLQQELRDRILGSQAHVYVLKAGGITDYVGDANKLRQFPHVSGAAPAVIGKALMTAAREEAFVSLKGIDPALEPAVTDLARAMTKGSVGALASPGGEGSLGGVILGKDLAAQLAVEVGDSVSVLTPQGSLSPMGPLPRRARLRVVGIFNLGLYEFDVQYGFVTIDVAKRLLDKDTIDLIQLRLDDIWVAPQVSRSIAETFGSSYVAQDWVDMNKSLFSALWLEKVAVSLAIGLIVMVAALNIVASLILLVMEKNRDIAILKTMGASARSVTLIFMLQGVSIGLVGTAVGATMGYGVAYVLDHYKLIHASMDVYQIAYMPFRVVLWPDFVLVIVTAVIICFLATILPSRQAARLDPAQALRYE
ncbi:MAG: ABC transporter permease [Acidobacteriota bacterium]